VPSPISHGYFLKRGGAFRNGLRVGLGKAVAEKFAKDRGPVEGVGLGCW